MFGHLFICLFFSFERMYESALCVVLAVILNQYESVVYTVFTVGYVLKSNIAN